MVDRLRTESLQKLASIAQDKYKMMSINQKHSSLLAAFLLLLPCFLTGSSAMATNLLTDQLALISLKSLITEPPSQQTLGKNWTSGSSVCTWIGVTCGSRHLRVTALNISNMNLVGNIPPHLGNLSFLVSLDMSVNYFKGELPVEFARFRRLKVLDLSINNFNGQFPHWIGSSIHELEHLNLETNRFTGVIPSSISNMSKLTTFVASFNYLQGDLPPEIFNMSSLEVIALGENHEYFSAGSLPDDLCRQLPRLGWLNLERTKLKGQIPSSIGKCIQLQMLLLGYNSLNGMIPRELGNLKGLQRLGLQNNSLEGSIPKEIGNLSMLQAVDFSYNHLKGVIPEEINKLPSIQEILFGFNELTGSIPVDIFNMSTISLVALSNNQLSGSLPPTMCNTLPYLQNLYLASNHFSGSIPNSISNCTYLQVLELSDNNFTGPIPNSLRDLIFLQVLNLWQNNLTSDPSSPVLNFITSLSNCRSLTALFVGDNPLNGILPESVGNLSFTLKTFEVADCKIRGTIPSGIGNLSSLDSLALHGNQLMGSLPSSVKNMQKLQGLYLRGNKLSISLQLFCNLPILVDLLLDENIIIGGAIPICFGNISSLRYLHLSSSVLKSELHVSFWNLKYLLELDLSSNSLSGSLPPEINNFKQATYMDFSSNYFSGDIPSAIGDLVNLYAFSLGRNKFQGQIPETIGNMLSLEQLDLSHNLLSGPIPMSLEKLQHLTAFDISFNNLSGEIPSQGPFTNFTAAPFISNRALCGAQRFQVTPCPKPSTQRMNTSGKNMRKIVAILVVVISATGIICLGFICLKYRKQGKRTSDARDGLYLNTHERISYYKLLRATEGYTQNNLLGVGSFGSVYKGILENGGIVAVKVFNVQLEGSFTSFDSECEVLRNLRHRNLTKVVTTCSNPDFKALVLEYMPNGNLDTWLHSNNCFLNVMQRLNIVIDVTCALQYLHCDNSIPIAHCDLKPSNVLLDQEMVAHVSDFGISKILGQENSITYTRTLATLGYIAPEYASEGLVSIRCDIYSFGIMIMEIFTGKRPSDELFGENLSLKSWVQESVPNALVNVIDADLISTINRHIPEILAGISSIMDVALACTNACPRERSNIEEVLTSLTKIRSQLLPYTDGSLRD